MEERRPTTPRNPSRSLAIAAVAVLVVIAIAGIVLAGMRGRGTPTDAPADATATQPASAAMTAAAAPDAALAPNQILFTASSDQLSEANAAKLAKFADGLKKDNRLIIIATKIEARPDRNAQMELAKKRVYAVRQVFEGRGVSLATMRIEITELPKGLVTAREGNLVEVVLR